MIGPAPDSPATRLVHVDSASLPRGETIPTPVMTTRRRPFGVLSAIRYIPNPPSTSKTAPVMKAASFEHRNRTAPATSSGSPSRPSGVA